MNTHRREIGIHKSNRHANDQIVDAEIPSAKLIQGFNKKDPDRFKIIVDRSVANNLSFSWKDEQEYEGKWSSSQMDEFLSQKSQIHDGRLLFKANNVDSGFVFNFDKDFLKINKKGDLVLSGTLKKPIDNNSANADNFGYEEVMGNDVISYHTSYAKTTKKSSNIKDIQFTFDTFDNSDWVDAAQDYHYTLTKSYVQVLADQLAKESGNTSNSPVSRIPSHDVNLDNRTFWFWDDIADAATSVWNSITSSASDVVDTASNWIVDNVWEPIADPSVWQSVSNTITDAWTYTDDWFNNDFYPALNDAWNSTINWFGDWLPVTGESVLLGDTVSLLDKEWSVGNARFSLKVDVSGDGDCNYSLPNNFYDFLNGDLGTVDLTIGLPLTASATAFLDQSYQGFSVPLVEEIVEGPAITLTIPQTGETVGGQIATSLSYGVDGTISGTPSEGISLTASVKPEIRLSASTKSGIQATADFVSPTYNTNIKNIMDDVTGLGLVFHATPSAEISLGLYLPPALPIIGGDKLATIGGTISAPMQLNVGADFNSYGWSSGLFFTPKAELGIAGTYSVDAKFLETFSDQGWISPLTYNITAGSFAEWSSGNILA